MRRVKRLNRREVLGDVDERGLAHLSTEPTSTREVGPRSGQGLVKVTLQELGNRRQDLLHLGSREQWLKLHDHVDERRLRQPINPGTIDTEVRRDGVEPRNRGPPS